MSRRTRPRPRAPPPTRPLFITPAPPHDRGAEGLAWIWRGPGAPGGALLPAGGLSREHRVNIAVKNPGIYRISTTTLGLPVVVGADAMEPRARRVAAAALLVVAWFGVLAPLHKAQSPAALDAVGAKPNNAAPPGEDAGGDADALATATATIPDADALMPLYATVAVKFGSDFVGSTLSVSVEYKPRKGSSLPSLWTAPETFLVDGMSATYSVDLFRLRAAQDYVYRVFAAAEGAAAVEVAGGYFTAQSTGWHRFDSGAYAAVSGDAPSFEVGAFAVYPSYTAHEQAKQWFQGLVAVDAEGWVVWMYSLCMLEAWDFLPDHTIALIARSDGSCSELTDHGKGTSAKSFKGEDGSLYEANSQLQKILPDGTLVTQFIESCGDGPLNFNKLSHECRVDKNSKDLQVLRAYVVDDLAAARAACAAAAEAGDLEARRENRRRFHSDVAERPLRSFLLTPLDEPRCHAGLRGLLASGSPLGDVFERACGGDDAQFYDFNALRTERGSPRQPVHWDTPFQERPPLYTAFVALQRVTREMGATLFLPGTHALDDGTRRGFDAGGAAKRAALEGARVFDGVLEPGDVTIFDMRVLHCGQPNLADLGDQRFFLNFTFCNPRADCSDLGHAPCIRPGYARRMTLADVRAQLASAAPFADLGDGLR